MLSSSRTGAQSSSSDLALSEVEVSVLTARDSASAIKPAPTELLSVRTASKIAGVGEKYILSHKEEFGCVTLESKKHRYRVGVPRDALNEWVSQHPRIDAEGLAAGTKVATPNQQTHMNTAELAERRGISTSAVAAKWVAALDGVLHQGTFWFLRTRVEKYELQEQTADPSTRKGLAAIFGISQSAIVQHEHTGNLITSKSGPFYGRNIVPKSAFKLAFEFYPDKFDTLTRHAEIHGWFDKSPYLRDWVERLKTRLDGILSERTHVTLATAQQKLGLAEVPNKPPTGGLRERLDPVWVGGTWYVQNESLWAEVRRRQTIDEHPLVGLEQFAHAVGKSFGTIRSHRDMGWIEAHRKDKGDVSIVDIDSAKSYVRRFCKSIDPDDFYERCVGLATHDLALDIALKRFHEQVAERTNPNPVICYWRDELFRNRRSIPPPTIAKRLRETREQLTGSNSETNPSAANEKSNTQRLMDIILLSSVIGLHECPLDGV